jgi:hypothetical protein
MTESAGWSVSTGSTTAEADQYVGHAMLSTGSVSTGSTSKEVEVDVEVTLRGRFEPLDGRFHWYGRIAADETLADLTPGSRVLVTTPTGSAEGRLSDVDPWGRLRVSGTGRPPF